MALSVRAILKQLRLAMPVAITVEDPLSKEPITLSHENLHEQLVVDLDALQDQAQVVAALYAEMGRFGRACQYESDRAEARYRAWRSKLVETLREKRRKAKDKAPTAGECESHYRSHKDYEEQATESARFKALAGFFQDLAKALEIKSKHLHEERRAQISYERVVRTEELRGAHRARRSEHASLAAEACALAADIETRNAEMARAMSRMPDITAAPPPPPPRTGTKTPRRLE